MKVYHNKTEGGATHQGIYFSPCYMADAVRCSCGWESHRYFDGSEYAWDEWDAHVASTP